MSVDGASAARAKRGVSGWQSTVAHRTATGNGTREFSSLRTGPRSRNTDFGRPTTPSWADFLSSGFADENGQTSPTPLLLPPDKVLPPIGEGARVHSSQSHMRHGLMAEENLQPGELASITRFDLDDTFWWVWITSLAAEEPTERKAVFGRCTLIETRISNAKWLVMEEQVKGASPGPEEGAYIAEKKGMFSFTRRGRLGRRKSTGKKPASLQDPYNRTTTNTPMSKTSIGPDQHARIQAAAARLAQKEKDQKAAEQSAQRRARKDDAASTKTNSVLTLQPVLVNEAGPAMKWDKKFGEAAMDRDALRAQYLGDVTAGRGSQNNLLHTANGSTSPLPRELSNRDLPSLPKSEVDAHSTRRDATPSPARLPPSPSQSRLQQPEASSVPQGTSRSRQALLSASLDDKPVPQPEQLDTHPAFRKPLPERKPLPAPEEPAPAPTQEPVESVPELVKKSPPKKLKKKDGGGGGFRKLFGKKKADAPVAAVPVHQPEVERDSYEPEPEPYSGRQLSATPAPRGPSPTYSVEHPDPPRSQSVAVQPSPVVPTAPHPVHAEDIYDEPLESKQAFSRFDQGPMDDMPAFVPEDDSDDEDLVAPNVPRHQTVSPPAPDTPPQAARAPATMDDVSEESVDLNQTVSPSQDRWAQIRKNAAERAARLSEEQSRRSRSQSARTDEGETSGEETIESRVARIKARVAELTGNMEGQGPGQQPMGRR